MFDHSYRQYEQDVAGLVRRRTLEREARRSPQASPVVAPRGGSSPRFRAWLRTLRLGLERRLRPLEDEGYLA